MIGLPQLARLLVSEKLIKHMPTKGEEKMLLEEVQEAVCIDYHMLLKFSECLLKNSLPIAAIGNIIKTKYSMHR